MKKVVIVLMLLSLFISNSVFALFTNDPYLDKQWYLDSANVYNAWDLSAGSSDVIVAVIDSGVDINHPDLKDNIWTNPKHNDDNSEYPNDIHGWNFIDNNNDVVPEIDVSCLAEKKCSLEGINHGTVVAGVIAAVANNKEGIAGIAYKTKIMPLKVLGPNGGGNVDDVVNAINYAVDNGASVINMSFVGDTNSAILKKTIENAVSNGVVFVVASGNNIEKGGVDLDKTPMYPVCSEEENVDDSIIGVSAIDNQDNRAIFANYGTKCVDVSAPGVKIFSTTVYKPQHSSFNNYYNGYWSGTSVAAPIVSATAAIIKSINKNFTPKQIKDIIVESGTDLKDKTLGKKINVYEAVKLAIAKSKERDRYFNIISGAGFGDSPMVKVLRDNGYEEANFLAYDKNFRGGVNVAYGDVFGDSNKYIITTPASFGGPHLRIFDKTGKLRKEFFVFDKKYTGGVNVAILNNFTPFAGFDIIVSQASGGSNVKVFGSDGILKSSFYPYGTNFKGGVNITSCNLDGGEDFDIITSASSAHDSTVKIFNNKGEFVREFLAFDKKYTGGVSIGCLDYDLDGKQEIATSVIYNNKPYIRILDKNGNFIKQFVINDQKVKSTINISGFYSPDFPRYRMVVSPKNSGEPKIRIFDLNGGITDEFYAYNKTLGGGVNFALGE